MTRYINSTVKCALHVFAKVKVGVYSLIYLLINLSWLLGLNIQSLTGAHCLSIARVHAITVQQGWRKASTLLKDSNTKTNNVVAAMEHEPTTLGCTSEFRNNSFITVSQKSSK